VAVTPNIISPLQLAMSTSFQPAEWDNQLFTNHPGVSTPLSNLQPSHIRLQPVSQGVPQTGPTTGDFSILDSIVQPVLNAGDQKPEFQIAVAPAFMNGSPTFDTDFATYPANLMSYYKKGGFLVNGTTYQSQASTLSSFGEFSTSQTTTISIRPNTRSFTTRWFRQCRRSIVP
jgi:hypothetical protein